RQAVGRTAGEVAVAAVDGRDRVAPQAQRRGRELGRPAVVQRGRPQECRAVVEGHVAGRETDGRGNRRVEPQRLPVAGRAHGNINGGGGRGLVDGFGVRPGGAARVSIVATVDGGDGVARGGQRRGGERCRPAAVQRPRAEEVAAVVEGDGPRGRVAAA